MDDLSVLRWYSSKEGFVLEFDESGEEGSGGGIVFMGHLYKFSSQGPLNLYLLYAKSVNGIPKHVLA